MGNSTRNILQATYTPLKKSSENDEGQRGLEKCAVVRYLSPTKEELGYLKNKYEKDGSKDIFEAILVLSKTDFDCSKPSCITAISEISSSTLIDIGQDLIDLRNEPIDQITHLIKELLQKRTHFDDRSNMQSILDWANRNDFKKDVAARIAKQSTSLGLDLSRLTCQDLMGMRERQIKQVEEFTTGFASTKNLDVNTVVAKEILVAAEKNNFRKELVSRIAALSKNLDLNLETLTLPDLIDSLKEQGNEIRDFIQSILRGNLPFDVSTTKAKVVLDWAIQNNFCVELAQKIITLAEAFELDLSRLTLREVFHAASNRIVSLRNVLGGFQESIKAEPMGYLHLEKLGFTPAGIERGELVYSVPLSPAEEVSISHKEWSQISEEFERIVTDELEEYSEKGVTEKSELAESVSSESQHSSAFNTGVTVSGEYGSVKVSANVGYNASTSSSNSVKSARNHSADITNKASSRAKKEHKVSFKVASKAETEDQTVQRIINPFKNRATRVDYYQLIRKWQVDLYRYGIRLTYDLVIPEPGSELLTKLKEMDDIKKELNIGFESVFNLIPSEINRDNYIVKASEYGVSVNDAPPEDTIPILVVDVQNWESTPGGYTTSYNVDINIPANYKVKDDTYFTFKPDSKGGGWGILVDDLSGYPSERLYSNGSSWGSGEINVYGRWANRAGRLSVWVLAWDVKHWAMSIYIIAKLTDAAYKSWQERVWESIRDGCREKYEERHVILKDRLARLEDELGDDALSLRKREREEVMKGVLRWMGIKDFNFYPSRIPADLYSSTGEVANQTIMETVLAQNSMIKFIHQAVEWENMLYFLYPYFWCHHDQWKFKKYLTHPDPLHRVFLKAGSARVVLTIRPGFEDAFMTFVNTGEMDPHPPYIDIGKEIQNYAQTNYPGIPPANPVKNYRPLLYRKQEQAWDEIKIIIKFLDKYKETNPTYPTTEQGLVVLQSLELIDENEKKLVLPAKDPWGNDYVYTCPGVHGDYDLASLGADRKECGEEENADITSWAEASLIGRWYEYTPTSALDIDFDAKLPKEASKGESESSNKADTSNLLRTLLNWLWRGSVVAILGLIVWLLLH